MTSYSICLSLPGLFHLLAMLLQISFSLMAYVIVSHCVEWVCTHTYHIFLPVHLLMDTSVVAMSIVARVSFWISVFGFFRTDAQKWDCWVVWYLYFFEKQPYCFLQWTHQFTFSPAVYRSSLFLISLSVFAICRLFGESHSDRWEVISHCGFDLRFSDD